MKNIRIIPRLDIKGQNVVKGIHTEGLRVMGDPKTMAFDYYRQGADEIAYMDIVASLYQRNIDFDLLKSVSENIFIPFTVGGGIRSLNDINNALRAGADKVAINTYAIKNPEFLREAATKFGSQCIVLSVEAIRKGQGWEAYTDGGREKTGIDAISWIRRALELGVGEILLTSIDRDGTFEGFDLDLMKQVTAFAKVPVVAHGGAGDYETIAVAILDGKADAVCVSSVLHYKKYSIKDSKQSLLKKGINVRI